MFFFKMQPYNKISHFNDFIRSFIFFPFSSHNRNFLLTLCYISPAWISVLKYLSKYHPTLNKETCLLTKKISILSRYFTYLIDILFFLSEISFSNTIPVNWLKSWFRAIQDLDAFKHDIEHENERLRAVEPWAILIRHTFPYSSIEPQRIWVLQVKEAHWEVFRAQDYLNPQLEQL